MLPHAPFRHPSHLGCCCDGSAGPQHAPELLQARPGQALITVSRVLRAEQALRSEQGAEQPRTASEAEWGDTMTVSGLPISLSLHTSLSAQPASSFVK